MSKPIQENRKPDGPHAVGSTDLLALRLRNAIADKEWCIACANADISKYGEWQMNWHARMQEIEQDLNDINAALNKTTA